MWCLQKRYFLIQNIVKPILLDKLNFLINNIKKKGKIKDNFNQKQFLNDILMINEPNVNKKYKKKINIEVQKKKKN